MRVRNHRRLAYRTPPVGRRIRPSWPQGNETNRAIRCADRDLERVHAGRLPRLMNQGRSYAQGLTRSGSCRPARSGRHPQRSPSRRPRSSAPAVVQARREPLNTAGRLTGCLTSRKRVQHCRKQGFDQVCVPRRCVVPIQEPLTRNAFLQSKLWRATRIEDIPNSECAMRAR